VLSLLLLLLSKACTTAVSESRDLKNQKTSKKTKNKKKQKQFSRGLGG
jgi:hypothetical protein